MRKSLCGDLPTTISRFPQESSIKHHIYCNAVVVVVVVVQERERERERERKRERRRRRRMINLVR